MKLATKFGWIVTMVAALTLMTACGSKKKSEDRAEQALIEQTQEFMADTGVEEETSEYTSNDYENSYVDSTTKEADLGASSSGLGH